MDDFNSTHGILFLNHLTLITFVIVFTAYVCIVSLSTEGIGSFILYSTAATGYSIFISAYIETASKVQQKVPIPDVYTNL